MQVVPHIDIPARVEQMTPRAHGLMVFFPCYTKRAFYGFNIPSMMHRPDITFPQIQHYQYHTVQEDNKTNNIDAKHLP